jgi:hypothetical protein
LGKIDARFLAHMEDVLWLYEQPYDQRYPVLCFDERPCFLVGDVLEPLALAPNQVRKEHYAYERHGSCALLATIEPLTGKRLAQVWPQRTKKEYAQFCQTLAAAYPEAIKIRLVQDNLNTHDASSFYAHLPAADAFALAQRFEFHYTPKAASWLNMIEIEFSAIARQCLDRRIPTIDRVKKEVMAIVKERDDKKVKINWQFSIEVARNKMSNHYQRVFADDLKCKRT